MISLDQARKIIAVTREKGRAMALKPLSVCVLDAGGHVLAFEREDGARPGRYEIAHAKAYGAVMLGMPVLSPSSGSARASSTTTAPTATRNLRAWMRSASLAKNSL